MDVRENIVIRRARSGSRVTLMNDHALYVLEGDEFVVWDALPRHNEPMSLVAELQRGAFSHVDPQTVAMEVTRFLETLREKGLIQDWNR